MSTDKKIPSQSDASNARWRWVAVLSCEHTLQGSTRQKEPDIGSRWACPVHGEEEVLKVDGWNW